MLPSMTFRPATAIPAIAILATGLIGGSQDRGTRAADCARLAGLKLPHTTITIAQPVTDGVFTAPGARAPMPVLPPFCRVAGVIAPTGDSEIAFEVWMPLEDWDGRFSGVGNGGFAGTINYGGIAAELRRGDASASTNTGHEAMPGLDMAKFAFGHPEKLIDFAYRSVHETTEQAKAIIQAFYGRAATHSYWIGCSSGGYQGLMEAQRFPADYDGIIAGAPANNFTRLMAGDLDIVLAAARDSGSAFPRAKIAVLHGAVLTACDAKDGVVDAVLNDPRACDFDPASVTCKAGQDPATCLTAHEAEVARRVYAGARDPASGAQIYPGLALGGEDGWISFINPAAPFAIPLSYYKWLAFADSTWDWKMFDLATPANLEAYRRSEAKFAPILNATSPDLRAFRQRGGKLLQYHGWSDQLISPQNSINYFESLVAAVGGDREAALRTVQEYYRLMMAPGMLHCGGGPGPNTFDMQTAVERWVEVGAAPETVIATRVANRVVVRSRPLCVYPKVAAWTGAGSTDSAASFVCRESK
jgi:feruloyl esterase